MEDLHVLSKQILDRKIKEGESKISELQKKAENKIEQTREKLAGIKKSDKESIQAELESDFDRKLQTLKNQQRNRILEEKQVLLSSVFDQAFTELSNWDENQFSTFLTGVLSQVDSNKDWVLVPGELSLHLIQEEKVQKSIETFSFLTVSDEVVNHKAGFILQQGGIDYNFCFDALVNELKKEFTPQLATLAFQKNE